MSDPARTRRHAWRPAALGATLASLVLVAAACSGSAAPAADSLNSAGGPVPAASAAARAAASAGNEAFGPLPGTDTSGTGSSGQTAPPAGVVDNRLIVYTGEASFQVTDLEAALTGAASAVRGVGGYVSASQRQGADASATATVTYRVPADRWEDAVAAIQRLASKVLSVKTSSDEVTAQVVDLGARIQNLQTTESALQAIMVKATKIPDILTVQEQLTSVQGQIEELSAQKQTLEKQAAMGTLTVTFSLPPVEVARVSAGWDPGAEIDHAAATLVSLGQGVASVGIWLAIVILPIAIVLLVIGVPLALVMRRARRRPSPPASGPIIPVAEA